ncbi:lipid-A-disaccharide synthase N-terminal domain-containing protein [Roseibium limicola]|uniref:Lipid-A-disaccharide synthase N-terminal domain-containing protein n=1 Tax=Roseibium limicola TaxID=2816037 RepID=A0A939EL71_9HYPH|nr:lipid-A-disaccharide synthase N-terminal domain-containing protein [Roseibium limicola]MBO0344624.1 lipid-A-disaccharide synthase N-terminal domain-containing protein [Roseibium limicola]
MDFVIDYIYTVFIQNFDFWLIFGLLAQAMFMMRFVVQWLASEKVGKSIVPIAFWFFSIAGGVMLLVYGLIRKEPILILGQGLGLVIYFRNLWLIFKEKRRDPTI